MEYVVVCLAAAAASGLTLFSGFGLGTLLMPVFAVFFPVEIAVAQTALVHFANNLFKLAVFGSHADRGVVLRFGLPAIGSAFLGAWTLLLLADMEPLARYTLAGREHLVTPVKLVIALLMAGFSALELAPGYKTVTLDRRWLPLGGLLSGFFGGLSGNQGAFRSVFLVRSGLTKEAFIATGVVIACIVDFSRLTVYSGHLSSPQVRGSLSLILAATLAAFLGVWISRKLVRKMTIRTLQVAVAVMLFLIAAGLGTGLI